MFDLVADIERYPEFIPYCRGIRVVARDRAGGKAVVNAEMVVAYRAFRERFTSRVALDRTRLRIDVEYLDGPFRKLHNIWRFQDLEDGSEVDFTIDFEFRSRLLQGLAGAVFDKVFARMTEAFVARAQAVYQN